MPTIVTRGVASARGAGTFSAAPPPPPTPPPPGPTPPPPPPPPTAQTVVFTSSGTWTAPSGVTNLTTLYVIGGANSTTAGQFIATSLGVFYSSESTNIVGSPNAGFTYAQVGSICDSILASVNSGGSGERTVSYTFISSVYNPNTGNFVRDEFVESVTIRGLFSPSSGAWDNRSSELVRGLGAGWQIGGGERYFPPETIAGGPSSAFGYTAQGGVTPEEVFQVNVPVVPGQTYTIQVGTSNGYVQFQFNQG